MASSIAELISERIDTMPAGERRAAQTLVANYPLIGLKTVADFSQQAGVSSPTILRFVARLGFQNYPEFQSALQDELAAQLQSPLSRTVADRRADLGGKTSPVLDATLDQHPRDLPPRLGKADGATSSALLANPRAKIYLVGGRFTDPLAHYMAAHLTIVRPNVFHLTGQESNWRDRLIDMGKRDVLLIFDIRRYQDSLIRLRREGASARRRDRAVHRPVAVADRPLRPLRHRRAHGGALVLGFVGGAFRLRRDADRRADARAGSRERPAHPRDGRAALERAAGKTRGNDTVHLNP